MGLRALRKKLAHKIKVGDMVTWSQGVRAEKVVGMDADGVYVDCSYDPNLGPRYFVSWEGGMRGKGPGLSPLVLAPKKT